MKCADKHRETVQYDRSSLPVLLFVFYLVSRDKAEKEKKAKGKGKKGGRREGD